MKDLISSFINTNDGKLLSPQEEIKLTNLYLKTKDVKIRNEIIVRNIRLVYKISSEYLGKNNTRTQDIISEGYIGLLKGVEHFDPSRGYKLSTYVSYWIRAYILDFILNDSSLIKLTTQTQRKLFFKLRKEQANLVAQGITPTADIVAQNLNVTESDVNQMDIRLKSESSLDEPTGFSDGGNILTKMDLLASEDATPDESYDMAEKDIAIEESFRMFRGSLNPTEKIVFESRMLQDETLRVVGDKINMSHERVRQIENYLITRLKRFSQAKHLENMI